MDDQLLDFQNQSYHYTPRYGLSYQTTLKILEDTVVENIHYYIKVISEYGNVSSNDKFIVILLSPYEDFLFYGASYSETKTFCGINLNTYERLGLEKTVEICEKCRAETRDDECVEIYFTDMPKGQKLNNNIDIFFDEHKSEPTINWNKLCMYLSEQGLIELRETEHEYRKNPYNIISINGEQVNCSVESLNYDENGYEIRNKLKNLITLSNSKAIPVGGQMFNTNTGHFSTAEFPDANLEEI